MAFPTIDREQSKKQLQLLGYKPGDNIYLRFFYPSDDPRKGSDAGRKLDKLVYPKAEKLQAEGRGCYFVVNGGGHNDDAVSHGRAIFFEHDDRPKEQSAQMWAELGLPEPTFQVDTGGKSIHSYWVFDQPVEIEKWRSLQADLLEFADADRQLKNPSRVMRLAGAWHLSSKGQFQSFICACSEKKYSFVEIRDLIPSTTSVNTVNRVSTECQHSGNGSNGHTVRVTEKSVNTVNTTENLSLRHFLTRDDRALIEHGESNGSRNASGAKLARNLLGTAQRLDHLGIHVPDDPYDLFLAYCEKCQPGKGWNPKEWDLIWKSARSDSPTPSLTDDAIQTCYRAWQWRQNKKSGNGNGKTERQQSVNIGVDTGDSQEKLDATATVSAVDTLLKRGLTDWEEQAELDKIQQKTVLSKDAYIRLVATLKTRLDEVLDADKKRLNQLIEWSSAELDFKKALPSLAEDLIHDAAVLNIDPIAIWQYLFPAVLSLIGKKWDLDVGSHKIPAVAWTALIGESGTGKSRAENLVLAPLKQWQGEERKRFESEQERYNDELRAWTKAGSEGEKPEKPEPERKFLFEVGTIQAVMRRLAEQPENGTLWARDEIAGLFKSLNQFSQSGEGEGLECLLKLWDGAPVQVDRVRQEDSYFVPSTRLSLAGGLQPLIFRKIFKDPDDAQGMQARFLFALSKVQPAKRVKGGCRLADKLPHLYKWIADLAPGTLKLSPGAEQRFDFVYEQINIQAAEAKNPAIRAWLRKLPTQILRIAIALHFLELWSDNSRQWVELNVETLERAIEVARYYRSVFQVVQETAADSLAPSGLLLKIWELAAKSEDGIFPRDAYRAIRGIGRRAKELNRQPKDFTIDLFHQLSELGRGQLKREGRQIKLVVVDTKNSSEVLTLLTNPQNDHIPSFEVLTLDVDTVDTVDRTQHNFTKATVTYDELEKKAEAGEIPAFDEQDVAYLMAEIAFCESAVQFHEWRLTALDQVQGEQLWAAVCDRLKVVDPEVHQKWFSPDSVTSSGGVNSVTTPVDTVEKSAALSFYEPGDVIVFDGQQYPVVKSDLSHVWIDGHSTHSRVAISEVRPASVEE